MIEFEAGRTYFTRSAADASQVVRITVASRTAKMLRTTKGKPLRITERDGVEYVKPWGCYSMAPMIGADKVEPAQMPAAEAQPDAHQEVGPAFAALLQSMDAMVATKDPRSLRMVRIDSAGQLVELPASLWLQRSGRAERARPTSDGGMRQLTEGEREARTTAAFGTLRQFLARQRNDDAGNDLADAIQWIERQMFAERTAGRAMVSRCEAFRHRMDGAMAEVVHLTDIAAQLRERLAAALAGNVVRALRESRSGPEFDEQTLRRALVGLSGHPVARQVITSLLAQKQAAWSARA